MATISREWRNFLSEVKSSAKNVFARSFRGQDGKIYVSGLNILDETACFKTFVDLNNLDILHALSLDPKDKDQVKRLRGYVRSAVRKAMYEIFPSNKYFLENSLEIGNTAFLVFRRIPGVLWATLTQYSSNDKYAYTYTNFYIDRYGIVSAINFKRGYVPVASTLHFDRVSVLKFFLNTIVSVAYKSNPPHVNLSFVLPESSPVFKILWEELNRVKSIVYPEITDTLFDTFKKASEKGKVKISILKKETAVNVSADGKDVDEDDEEEEENEEE